MLKAARTLGIVFFPAFDWAISPTHPERQERLLYTQDQLREEGVFDIPGISEIKPDLATAVDVARVHFCFPDVAAVTTASHMTVLALKLSRFNNGVSKLHGVVSRKMWNRVWNQYPVEDVPIGAITNGVHVPTWVAQDMRPPACRVAARQVGVA